MNPEEYEEKPAEQRQLAPPDSWRFRRGFLGFACIICAIIAASPVLTHWDSPIAETAISGGLTGLVVSVAFYVFPALAEYVARVWSRR